ncbi:MAG: maleate cis-trans isomerase [Clostridiales bacterium]|nr:maleate cis-trans isomerase [Clostridiales bacterium]
MYCGWRARIGLIMPSSGTYPEHEFHEYAPEGVTIMTQRVLFERVDPQGLSEMGARVDEAAKILSKANPDLIIFGCTSGSLIKGIGYDKEIIKRIEDISGTKALTTTSAIIMAFKALGSKRLVVSTPYIDEVNEIEKKFLEDSGFEVLNIKGLQNIDPNLMPLTPMPRMYKLTREVLHPEADTIFVSCTGLGVMHGINMMEKDFGLPVVTSTQASIWAVLRTLSINDDIGVGKLFSI